MITGCGVNNLSYRIYCPDWSVTLGKMAVLIIRAYP
jgi:hypothetical protein